MIIAYFNYRDYIVTLVYRPSLVHVCMHVCMCTCLIITVRTPRQLNCISCALLCPGEYSETRTTLNCKQLD